MGKGAFVGRESEGDRIRQIVERGEKRKGLVVQSIEGPGGVGKSSLFRRSLREVDLAAHGYLKLEVTGSAYSVKDSGGNDSLAAIDQVVAALVASADNDAVAAKPPGYFFPATRDAITAVNEVRAEIRKELIEKWQVNPDDIESVKKVIKGAALVARIGNFFPNLPQVDANALSGLADEAEDTARQLNALQEGTVYLWERLGIGSASTLREAVKKDPAGALANALVADLKAILLGDHEGNALSPGHGKIKGAERLLLIIDDYEALMPVLDSFLVDHLLKLLKQAGFPCTVIVLGRDKLVATNAAWDKDHADVLADRLRIRPLAKPQVIELLQQSNVLDAQEYERAWSDTQGLPFHVHLWMEELEDGGRSALALKQLYDRITIWMNKKQIEWMEHVAFMPAVTEDSLSLILGDDDEGRQAYEWFEGEASIRDQFAMPFKMIEFARSRVQDYIALRSPRKFAVLSEKARALAAVE